MPIPIGETQILVTFFHHYAKANMHLMDNVIIPTQVQEGNTSLPQSGTDLLINGNLFFQFKRPSYSTKKHVLEVREDKLPESFLPYYRFNVKNSPNSYQFDTLMNAAKNNTNLVQYVSPFYYDWQTYNAHLKNPDSNLALKDYKYINFAEFVSRNIKLSKDDSHKICYNKVDPKWYLFSEPEEFKSSSNEDLAEFFTKVEAMDINLDFNQVSILLRNSFPLLGDKLDGSRDRIIDVPFLQEQLKELYNVSWAPIIKLKYE